MLPKLISAYFDIIVFSLSVKLLLIPAYHSTDFEVHRNWLAITHSLPISKWYFEDTSIWTLDYPPFFAYFERILAFFAKLIDPQMLQIQNLDYEAQSCILFQRITVIASDLLYGYAIYRASKAYPSAKLQIMTFAATFLQIAMVIVDHFIEYLDIHFQYNSLLQGFLILSIVDMLEKRYLRSAILFTVLLNFKHIYIYVAPAYFFFLLKKYCLMKAKTPRQKFESFLKLAGCVVLVFLVSFGPFLSITQLQQILSRLFPFQRGLVHAYWAPNFWALYCFSDRFLAFIAKKILKMNIILPDSSPNQGIVREIEMAVLPNVGSKTCLALVLISLLPLFISIWKQPKRKKFVEYCIISAFAFFFFGYHVHEKAILIILNMAQLIWFKGRISPLSTVTFSLLSGLSLLPLLPFPQESTTKVLLLLLYNIMYYLFYRKLTENRSIHETKTEKFIFYSSVVVAAGVLLFDFGIHPFIRHKMEFLNLMIYSVSIAFYNGIFFLRWYRTFLVEFAQNLSFSE